MKCPYPRINRLGHYIIEIMLWPFSIKTRDRVHLDFDLAWVEMWKSLTGDGTSRRR